MLKQFITYLKNTFVDCRCVICGTALEYNEYGVCHECEKSDLFFQPQLHYRGNILEERLYGLAKFETAEAIMQYSEHSAAQTLIHNLKYHNSRNIAKLFGKLISNSILNNNPDIHFDYVIPVPLHPYRQFNRGYNQSELIAKKISSILNIPIESHNLYRAKNNDSQTHKSAYERAQNAKNIFSIHDDKLFSHKTVLLIDDVFTTGSTIIDCCRALNLSDNIKIHIFTATATHIYQ